MITKAALIQLPLRCAVFSHHIPATDDEILALIPRLYIIIVHDLSLIRAHLGGSGAIDPVITPICWCYGADELCTHRLDSTTGAFDNRCLCTHVSVEVL